MLPRESKLAVASMTSVISYVVIFCVTVTCKSILLGTFGIWAGLILFGLSILAIILGAIGQRQIQRSDGAMNGSRWASGGKIAEFLLLLVAIESMVWLPGYIAVTRRVYDGDVNPNPTINVG